jgi:asparagine synthase (glutamine-hydrolysing)
MQSLLHVEDRTSMAWGLESRVPLLDYRMVDLMASVKPTVKFKDGRLKHLFLQAIHVLLPEVIWSRKDKMGFPVPLSDWTKGPLREFMMDTLGSQSARERGIFDTDALLHVIDKDQAFGRTAWGALCLELWHKQFVDKPQSSFN